MKKERQSQPKADEPLVHKKIYEPIINERNANWRFGSNVCK